MTLAVLRVARDGCMLIVESVSDRSCEADSVNRITVTREIGLALSVAG